MMSSEEPLHWLNVSYSMAVDLRYVCIVPCKHFSYQFVQALQSEPFFFYSTRLSVLELRVQYGVERAI